MTFAAVCVAAFVLTALPVQAKTETPKTETPKKSSPEAGLRISRAIQTGDFFSVGGTGVMRTPSPGERRIIALIRANDRSKLAALLLKGDDVDRLYGLLALRFLHDAGYAEALHLLESSQASVVVMDGCEPSEKKVADLARDIEIGRFDAELSADVKPSKARRH